MQKRNPGSSAGFSLLEVIFAIAILVAAMIPLTNLMTTTNRGAKLTRDHLIASTLAEMAIEQFHAAATEDAQASFDRAVTAYSTPDGASGASGCPGVPISALAQKTGDTIMPADGDATLDPAVGEPDYVSLYQRYSYSMSIKASGAPSVTTTDGRSALARVDVRVYWKDIEGNCQSVGLSDFVARRDF